MKKQVELLDFILHPFAFILEFLRRSVIAYVH
jgi:hypothetical protein